MMIRFFPQGKVAVFSAMLLSAFFLLKTPTSPVAEVTQETTATFVSTSFSSKAEIALPDVLPVVSFSTEDEPNPEAMRLASHAMELRFDRLNIALHLMAEALSMDNHPEIREQAEELLSLTAFTFEEEWAVEGESVNAIAVSPDGELIAVGDDFGNITILSSDGEELASSSAAHDNTIDALAFSPSGEYLAAGSHDDYFSIWKVEGTDIDLDARHYYGEDWVRSLVFSPDGSELYVAGDVYYSLVYNMDSRSVTDTLGEHDYYIYAIDVSDDGEVIATGDGDGLLKVWVRTDEGWKESESHYLSSRINDLVFDSERTLYIAMTEGEIAWMDLTDPYNSSEEYLTEEGKQEYSSIALVGGAIIAGGDGSRIDVFNEAELGTALVGGYVSEIEDFDGESFLLGADYTLKKGSTLSQESMTIAELMNGEGLKDLTVEEKLEFNLLQDDELSELSNQERISLFSRMGEIMEGYAWEHTDVSRVSSLAVNQAEQAITSFLASPDDAELAAVVKSAIPVLGKNAGAFGRALESESDAAKAVMWLSLGSKAETSTELKKYAGRRAYAIQPNENWGQIIESGLSDAMAQIEVADFELSYGCDANSVMFSPDGSYLFVTTDRAEDCEGGYLYPVSDGIANEARGLEYPHQSNIMWQGAFSIDGQRIASSSTDGTVIIYNLNGGTEHIFANEEGEVGFSDARILRDGTVITADNNGMILKWTLGNIVPDEVIAEHDSEARKLAIIKEETIALSVGYGGILYVHDLSSGETEEISINNNGIDDITINADETLALLGFVSGGGAVVDLESWEVTQEIRTPESNDYQSAAFVGEYLVFGTDAGALIAYDQQGNQLFSKRIHDGTVYDISVSPDGNYIATAGGDDRVTIWSKESLIGASVSWISTSWESQKLSSEDWGELLSMAGRSGDEEAAAEFVQGLYAETPKGPSKDDLKSAIENGLFFKLEGRKVKPKGGLRMFTGFPEGLNGIHYSSSMGQAIALGDAGTIFSLTDDGGFEELAIVPNTEPRCFTELSDGGWAVAEPGYVYILDENFEVTEELEPHDGTIYDISLSADGSYLATASADYDLALIDTESFGSRAVRGHDNEANAVAFFTDGSGFVSGADDQTVKFWDMSGNLKRSANIGTNVWAIDVSPDGDRVIAGTNEGELILLDGSGTEYKRWTVESNAFWAVTFAPDGQTFAAGNNDGDVSVWGRNGEVKFNFDTGEATIFEIAYSDDGKFIFVATTDGEVYRFLME